MDDCFVRIVARDAERARESGGLCRNEMNGDPLGGPRRDGHLRTRRREGGRGGADRAHHQHIAPGIANHQPELPLASDEDVPKLHSIVRCLVVKPNGVPIAIAEGAHHIGVPHGHLGFAICQERGELCRTHRETPLALGAVEAGSPHAPDCHSGASPAIMSAESPSTSRSKAPAVGTGGGGKASSC